jgi:hypothetical protein
MSGQTKTTYITKQQSRELATRPFPHDGLVTQHEVAAYLDQCAKTIQRLTAKGILPVVKSPLKRFVRYDAAVIRALFGESETKQQPKMG